MPITIPWGSKEEDSVLVGHVLKRGQSDRKEAVLDLIPEPKAFPSGSVILD